MNADASRFNEKVVLVTGSSSGTGAAIARAFARSGARVALNCRSDLAGAERLAAEIRTSSRENNATSTRDEITSESGLGPAWIRPSWRIEISENGEAAARSSKARSFGCRPSLRDAAKTLN
jgi:NAD(P)-dependent dehydrogenase (short-subunit alcohol dehydrogenase family)